MPLPWLIHTNAATKKAVTWQAPQMPPTLNEEMLPQGPLPQPPPMSEDTQGNPYMNHTTDVQCDMPGGKRSKDEMKIPGETSTAATAITATPQPKRSKKELLEGDSEMELHPGPPTVTEHFVVATPTRQRSPLTISPTQPFNHAEVRSVEMPPLANTTRNLPSLQLLEGAQINLIAQQSALGEERNKVQQDQRGTVLEAPQTGPSDHEKLLSWRHKWV